MLDPNLCRQLPIVQSDSFLHSQAVFLCESTFKHLVSSNSTIVQPMFNQFCWSTPTKHVFFCWMATFNPQIGKLVNPNQVVKPNGSQGFTIKYTKWHKPTGNKNVFLPQGGDVLLPGSRTFLRKLWGITNVFVEQKPQNYGDIWGYNSYCL